jgi:hypothetical protein
MDNYNKCAIWFCLGIGTSMWLGVLLAYLVWGNAIWSISI